MFFTNFFTYDGCRKAGRQTDCLTMLHRIACVLFILLSVYFFITWLCSFFEAWDDIHKFERPITLHYFLFYLGKNDFLERAVFFLSVSTELLIYIAQYHKLDINKSNWRSILYFSVMLALHIVLWMHAYFLQLPESPPFSLTDSVGLRCRAYANTTIIPAFTYFILYVSRFWKSHVK